MLIKREEILKKLQESKHSVSDISNKSGVSVQKIYKFMQGRIQGKYEDVILLDKYFKEFEGYSDTVIEEPKAEYSKTDFQALYIEQLKKNEATLTENIRLLEEQLRNANEKAAASLDYIAEATRAQLAHQKALAWYQAYQAAGGNEKKLLEELKRLNNKTAEYADLHSNKGSRLSS